MPGIEKNALAAHRRRLKLKGIARVELRVPAGDAPLLRGVADALCDPARGGLAREILRSHFGLGARPGLKALLASAPLDGVELERDPAPARDVEF
ncbi:hypothetical protein D3874_22730 [Oleomonas cavernae]|uniref:Uncharacterized protein n=1 Tax=Oleomonas cavernae TaxID=2320859 RepID=A0A418WHR7_9PROT|nr:hypothetical protein [Oleomonas cavernae]RJF89439.1 hypothetical protein D3874_22730 [Oleomonas cavernae]